MKDQDQDEFSQRLDMLAISLDQELHPMKVEGYWIALQDLPLESVKLAINRALRECSFFPKPAELRDLAGVERLEDRVIVAFDALKKSIGRQGGYVSIEFDDPAITATVRALGGWERLTGLPSEEINKWYRKDFEKTYPAFARRGVTAEQAAPLLGFHDVSNIGEGHQEEPEVIVIETGLSPTRLLEAHEVKRIETEES